MTRIRVCHSPPTPSSNTETTASTEDVQYHVQLLTSIADIEGETWDRYAAGGSASPFLLHDWIRCLEQSGCATPQKGWAPSHIIVRNDAHGPENIVCIVPAYVKGHSMGEFVFDQEWADAAYGAGIMYYPKLLIAIPFTPATGRRLLTRSDVSTEERQKILRLTAKILTQVCQRLGVSSVHVNFCEDDEINALQQAGFMQRKGVQYHFTNVRKGQAAINAFEKAMEQRDGSSTGDLSVGIDKTTDEKYRDFDDYLNEFKSKKRIKMRRERKVVREESGLRIDVVNGEDGLIGLELLDTMYEIYKSTIEKLLYGRQYLSRQFFQMLDDCPRFKKHICLVLARREDNGRVIGGTFNIVDGTTFYGRYWGCVEDYRFLHFEACYYAAIEYCIEHGLERMEPGAGGGEFKYMRGFEPSVTNSMHYVRDKRLADAVERYLYVEGLHVDGAVDDMTERSAIRSKAGKE